MPVPLTAAAMTAERAAAAVGMAITRLGQGWARVCRWELKRSDRSGVRAACDGPATTEAGRQQMQQSRRLSCDGGARL